MHLCLDLLMLLDLSSILYSIRHHRHRVTTGWTGANVTLAPSLWIQVYTALNWYLKRSIYIPERELCPLWETVLHGGDSLSKHGDIPH